MDELQILTINAKFLEANGANRNELHSRYRLKSHRMSNVTNTSSQNRAWTKAERIDFRGPQSAEKISVRYHLQTDRLLPTCITKEWWTMSMCEICAMEMTTGKISEMREFCKSFGLADHMETYEFGNPKVIAWASTRRICTVQWQMYLYLENKFWSSFWPFVA